MTLKIRGQREKRKSKLTQKHPLAKHIHFPETSELPCIALPKHGGRDAHKHRRQSQHAMALEHWNGFTKHIRTCLMNNRNRRKVLVNHEQIKINKVGCWYLAWKVGRRAGWELEPAAASEPAAVLSTFTFQYKDDIVFLIFWSYNKKVLVFL